jgi:hypothetical protein
MARRTSQRGAALALERKGCSEWVASCCAPHALRNLVTPKAQIDAPPSLRPQVRSNAHVRHPWLICPMPCSNGQTATLRPAVENFRFETFWLSVSLG